MEILKPGFGSTNTAHPCPLLGCYQSWTLNRQRVLSNQHGLGAKPLFFFFSCLLVMVFKLFSPKQGTVLVRGTWGRLLHLLSHDSLDDGSELWGKSPSVGATLP